MVYLINSFGMMGSFLEKIKLDLYCILYIMINFKCITNLYVKKVVIKILYENLFFRGNVFLIMN